MHVRRARKLLYGGLTGGLTAGLICIVIFTAIDGLWGLGSSALGVGMVLFFYAVGQLVMVQFANAGARTLMAVSMTSYTGRVVILGLILLIFSNHRDTWPAIDANAIFIATVAVVAGWLVVEVYVFRRLRISIYDSEYAGRSADGDAAGTGHNGVSGDDSVSGDDGVSGDIGRGERSCAAGSNARGTAQ
jgi:hypothetical protein